MKIAINEFNIFDVLFRFIKFQPQLFNFKFLKFLFFKILKKRSQQGYILFLFQVINYVLFRRILNIKKDIKRNK